jgi:type I restriction enzyme M protein
MLDAVTKKRIDDCRDILVGKVPDPKSQVEQITIALIYKFMDDMDAEAEELGGSRSFFAGAYARFGWAQLMSPGLGGFEVLALYSEAIQSMRENPGVPELFRDIFKNAYLPYRDPETLKSFLKEINGFTYDHSERLGDAFEYLLSVLGSQGDAGQFRTPRHIIDFMVAVLDPQKNDTILDPACGTAGFLISAWKHILAANTTPGAKTPGDRLTPDERARLAGNIKGYDISPDMVRLSLVNLYLHGFADPHIVEYDTLTQDDKWNELADVILANPPFMSPKGGIKPHKRFSVQATRSEVLFVDYMAEHLTATGRAAIVVPEGIIFQSGSAYKALRKMLVESSLVAVVSLPAGVFNPYSGVKTSILFLDKRVHKQADSVLFVKVQNDGFNLGAQRRAVAGSDLAEAQRLLRRWITGPMVFDSEGPMAQVVARSRIGEGGDFNLSGERYGIATTHTATWPMVPLGEIIDELESGVSVNSENRIASEGEVGVLKTSCVTAGIFDPEEHKAVLPDERSRVRCSVKRDAILISRMNTEALVGANAYVDKGYGHLFLPDRLWQTVISRTDISTRFVQAMLASQRARTAISAKCGGTSGSMKNIAKPQFLSVEIPLPPLEVQQQIVAEVEGYQRVIDGARQVLNAYKVQIAIDPAWNKARVDDLCVLVRGSSPRPQGDPKFFGGQVPRLMVADITRDGMRVTPAIDTLTEEGAKKSRPMLAGSVVMAVSGNPGLPAILQVDACIHDGFVGFRDLDAQQLLPEFFYYVLLANKDSNQSQSVGAVFMNLTTDQIREFLIPVPDLPTQRAIVAEIEAEQALVNANRELIRRMEAKIKVAIDRVWGSDAPGLAATRDIPQPEAAEVLP